MLGGGGGGRRSPVNNNNNGIYIALIHRCSKRLVKLRVAVS